jgi:hypothetical protein
LYLFTGFGFKVRWQSASIYHYHHFIKVWAKGLICYNLNRFRIHPDYGLFKAWKNLTFTNGKLKRFVVSRETNDRAIPQSNRIMYLYRIALFCLFHLVLLSSGHLITQMLFPRHPLTKFRP